MAKSPQKFDDKMLEVFTFDNGLETGLEKVIKVMILFLAFFFKENIYWTIIYFIIGIS